MIDNKQEKAIDKYKTHDPMAAFLYILMRDCVVPGEIERIITSLEPIKEYYILSNWFLGQYAKDVVNRLRK